MASLTIIKLTGENHGDVDEVCDRIKAICENSGVAMRGPIPLPTRRLVVPCRKSPDGEGCETYDLWGLEDPEIEDDPMVGVNRFKEGFQPRKVLHPGAYDRPLNQLSYLALTRVLMPARAAWQSIRAGRATDPPPG